MDISLNREGLLPLSPFGRKIRPFTEVDSQGNDFILPRGSSLPDLIRAYYNPKNIKPLSERFGFLDRDNKRKSYSPGIEDKFVFKNSGSVGKFREDALEIIRTLCKEWTELGLPLKTDKDRGIDIPDSAYVWEMLDSRHEHHTLLITRWEEISFILSNVDIAKKACVVRGIIPGWWTASYGGKYAPDINQFSQALSVFRRAIKVIESSSKYASTLAETKASLGDPLDTSVGYPYFTGVVDPVGNPISKLAQIKLYKGLGTQGFNWEKVLGEVDKRCPVGSLKGFPFAVAPLRRLQYGYKFAHTFKSTSQGLTADYDERGGNTIRIAWMASYPLNLYMSPFQARMKALRKLIPGCYHDGLTKSNRVKWMKKPGLMMAEADYTNYDRFMPINLVHKIVEIITEGRPNEKYWRDMIAFLHEGIPMIWPDYITGFPYRGWVFTPERIGLLSGVKITSDIGTYVNLIITLQSALNAGVLSEQSAVAYLTQYTSSDNGSLFEYFHIQSDDLLLLHTNAASLKKLGDAFTRCAKFAGLKANPELGDRFLMRHNFNNKDAPVPMRVWQNTLSNETPEDDPVKFVVGIAMRTDGLFGYKTIDPFHIGKATAVSLVEVRATLKMLLSIRSFIVSATSPLADAVSILDILIEGGRAMERSGNKRPVFPVELRGSLDLLRKQSLDKLVAQELSKLNNPFASQNDIAMIYKLYKDSNIPSQKMLLDQMVALAPNLRSVLGRIEGKESSFYKYAISQIGIDVDSA